MACFRTARLTVAIAVCQLLSTTSAQSFASLLPPTLISQPALAIATSASTQIALGSSLATRSGASITRSGASATPSASSEPQVHTIKVGPGAFKFVPQELTNISVGDIVTFDFYPPDHSVVQAEYGSACVPYSYVDKDHEGKGFWTETQWVDTNADVSSHISSIQSFPGRSRHKLQSIRNLFTRLDHSFSIIRSINGH